MFIFNSSLANIVKEDRQGNESVDRVAIEISRENEAHMAENKILSEQNELDEHTRNELEKQFLHHTLTKDEIIETEKLNRQLEYRQFLLKQIEDKEKEKKSRNSTQIQGNSYVYSEELVAPEMRKTFKLTKQQEMKSGLDECIRVKNVFKQENKKRDIEEERLRMNFLETQECNKESVGRRTKYACETNELKREEAVKSWKTDLKDDEREQFMDLLLKKDTTLSELENKSVIGADEVQVENDMIEQQAKSAEIEEEPTHNEGDGSVSVTGTLF